MFSYTVIQQRDTRTNEFSFQLSALWRWLMNIVEFDTDIEHEDSNTLCMKCLQGNDSGRDIDTKL